MNQKFKQQSFLQYFMALRHAKKVEEGSFIKGQEPDPDPFPDVRIRISIRIRPKRPGSDGIRVRSTEKNHLSD
jgi:hypothetical protein